MFDTVFFLVLSVIFSGTLSDFFLNYLDKKYGISTFMWYFVTYLFVMLPMGIYKYANDSSKCKQKKDSRNEYISNIIQAIKSAAITVGMVDILSFIIRFIPIVGNIVSILEFIPLIGTPSVWLGCYFIYYCITHIFSLLFMKKIYCSNIGLTSPLIFSFISIFKSFILDFLPY
mgnify:CR=1 FL=1|tara:strand:- start:184 stop:702 length:519 start_codon:yes stop_codon:yes gene_type:complete